MKNIVLVTHGEFATGIVTSLELVYGKSENLGNSYNSFFRNF